MTRPAIPDILDECLEELGFVEARLAALAFSPDVPERRLAEQLVRRDGWHDCLVQHPDDTVQLAEAWLDAKRPPWLHAAAASAWLEFKPHDAVAFAVRVQDEAAEQLADWRHALRARPVDAAWAREAARAERPTNARHLWLDALGWHGALTGALLEAAAADPEPTIRWAAARHAASVAGGAAVGRALANDPDPAVARQARYSLCLADPAAGAERARRLADDFDAWLLGLFGTDGDVPALEAAAARFPEAAAQALADLGTRAACTALVRLGEPAAAAAAELVATAPATVEAWDAAAQGARALLHGRPRPWAGAADEEPLLFRWRAALTGTDAARRRLRPSIVAGGEPGVLEPGA